MGAAGHPLSQTLTVILLMKKERNVVVRSRKVRPSPRLHLTLKSVSSKQPTVLPCCKPPVVVPPHPWDLLELSLASSLVLLFSPKAAFFFPIHVENNKITSIIK